MSSPGFIDQSGRYRVDRSRLEQVKEEWLRAAEVARQARQGSDAAEKRQEASGLRAKKTVFSYNVTQGNVALQDLATSVLSMKQHNDFQDAAAAQLYGSVLTLQRTSFTLATLMGDEYTEHLKTPLGAKKTDLLDLTTIEKSVAESTKVVVHVINVLRQILEGQRQAKARLSDITSLVSSVTIPEAVLKDLAEGAAPRGFAESLEQILIECSECINSDVNPPLEPEITHEELNPSLPPANEPASELDHLHNFTGP